MCRQNRLISQYYRYIILAGELFAKLEIDGGDS